MREEILEKLRQERAKIVGSIQKENARIARLEELSNDPKVKEFMKLSKLKSRKKLDNVLIDEDKIVETLMKKYYPDEMPIEETNQVYVCLGKKYMAYRGEWDFPTLDCDGGIHKSRPYALYTNIECDHDFHIVALSDCEKFEQTHQVIFAGPYDYYDRIQKDFVLTAVKTDQASALTKVKSKYVEKRGE